MQTENHNAVRSTDPSGHSDSKSSHVPIWVAVITAGSVLGAALIAASYGSEKLTELDAALATVKALTSIVQEQGIQLRDAKIATEALQNSRIGSAAGEGQKLCRVLLVNKWSDGMIVPKDWSMDMCTDYMRKTKGTKIQLGCIKIDEITLGGEDGTKPSPNCGW